MGNKIYYSKLKRLLAFLFDIAFISLLTFTVYMLLGMIFKIDSDSFHSFIFPLLLLLLAGYLFFGDLVFNNTLGRYLTGIEISGKERPGRPSEMSLFKRGLLKIIFPIEGLVLLFSKNMTRLGDIWADTIVVSKQNNRFSAVSRIVLGFTVIIVLIFTFRISMGLAVQKADFYNIGIKYLTDSGEVKISGMVKEVELTSNTVNFIIPVSNVNKDKYAIIYLSKTGKEWSVDRAEFTKEHIIGFSYSFGK